MSTPEQPPYNGPPNTQPPPAQPPPVYGYPQQYGYSPPGYPQQYGYPPPAYGQYPAPARTNSLATAGLVCSIAGVAVCLLACIAGIICGHIARGQIRRTGEGGAGLALAALIVGYTWLALGVIAVIVIVTIAANSTTTVM
jgi:hypothetical protein